MTTPLRTPAETLEAAAGAALAAWLTCPYGEIADADTMMQLSEFIEERIRSIPIAPPRVTEEEVKEALNACIEALVEHGACEDAGCGMCHDALPKARALLAKLNGEGE